MARLIKKHNITIPVIYLSGNEYLIGPQNCFCDMSGEDAVVRVSPSGPHTKFEDFVTRNHRKFERKLVWYMIRTQQSLNWVI